MYKTKSTNKKDALLCNFGNKISKAHYSKINHHNIHNIIFSKIDILVYCITIWDIYDDIVAYN